MNQRNRPQESYQSPVEKAKEQQKNGAKEAGDMGRENTDKTNDRLGGTKAFDKAKFTADYRKQNNLGVNEPLGQNATRELMVAMQNAMKNTPQPNIDSTKKYAGVKISSYQTGARTNGQPGAGNIAGGVGVE